MIFYFINGSCLVLSAIKPDFSGFCCIYIPNPTPQKREIGRYYIFLMLSGGVTALSYTQLCTQAHFAK